MFHELGTGKCFVSKDAILNSCVVFIVPWGGGMSIAVKKFAFPLHVFGSTCRGCKHRYFIKRKKIRVKSYNPGT